MKTVRRKIEIFTADCPLCREAVTKVQALACPSCEVVVYNLREEAVPADVLTKVQDYGVTAVPSVAVNGRLLDCCRTERLTPEILREAGIGVS